MKYYKNTKTGKIYLSTSPNVCEFKEVSESEYLLQEAREKYPVGTRFISIHQQKQITSFGSFYFKEKATLEGGDCIYCEGWDVYRNGKWAEIISTSKEEKSELTDQQKKNREIIAETIRARFDFVSAIREIKKKSLLNNVSKGFVSDEDKSQSNIKEVKMTHQEAIENLKLIPKYSLSKANEEAINYAINQLNKCEVFEEPVEMEVSNSDFAFFSKAKIIGKFNGKYLSHENLMLQMYKSVRPIKKYFFSFTEWCQNQSNQEFYNLTMNEIDKYYEEYTEYLNKVNK